MGLFGGGKIIAVDSVVYNMAGPEEDRPHYLKSLIVRNVLSDTRDSIAQTLNNGYLHGPAIQLRSFYRWANRPENYGIIGMPTGHIGGAAAFDPQLAAGAISISTGQTVWVQDGSISDGDITFWAEQWMLANRPAEIDTDWRFDYDRDDNKVTITFENNTTEVFTPTDFDYNSKYLYAYYYIVTEDQAGPLTTGPLIDLSTGPLPDMLGWGLNSETHTTTPVTLVKKTTVKHTTVKQYSDGRPDEITVVTDPPTTESTAAEYDEFEKVYQRFTYTDDVAGTMEYQHHFQTRNKVVETSVTTVTDAPVVTNEGGVTVTSTTTHQTTVDNDVIRYLHKIRTDTQELVIRDYSDMQLLIYKMGSGIADLDTLITSVTNYGQFFPFIPFRLFNKFLSETVQPEAFEQVTKAYKKATGSKLSKLVDQLKENEDLDDIDHTYVVFGVSLNVVEKACKKYLYNFFENLQAQQLGGPNTYATWQAAVASQNATAETWLAWLRNRKANIGGRDNGPNNDPEPPRPRFPALPVNDIRIRSTGTLNAEYNIRLEWTFIHNGSGTGLGKAGAKVGDCWIGDVGSDTVARTVVRTSLVPIDDATMRYQKFRIYWQRTADSYTWIEVVGAIHKNYVYKGKAVVIGCKDALEDPEESGFIVPLHYETWRQMSLVDTSQMATACVFAVFNCYVVKKKKWYQSGIFKVIFIVVIAIASVVFTGGAGLGLLGAHLTVGVSLGFTGMTAAIVGAVANALAALVLATILEKVAMALGPLGQLIAAVLMIVVMDVAAAFRAGGSLALNWGNLLRVDNLLKLVDAVGNGISQMLNADTIGLQNEFADFQKKAEQEARKIQQTYFDEFGYGGGIIDPLMFVDSSTKILAESSDTFLTRTLMTGSEIADMSRELLYNFSEYSLKLPDAFS